MRIVQILDTLRVGGAQKMQVFLASSLHTLGIELTVVNLSRYADSALVRQLEEAGARIVEFPFPRLFSPISFFRLVMFLHRQKFDLVHAYLTYSNIIGSLAGRLTGIPVIASLRNAEYRHHKFIFRKYVEDFSFQYLADRVMANGNAVGDFARKRSGRTPVDVIVNAVDMIPSLTEEERIVLRHELVGDAQRLVVLSVGRLTRAKGFFDLLDAFKIIHSAQPNAVLVIAGGGTLRDGLNRYMQELGLQNDVFLLGSRHDVPRLLAAADIYVNSSHWEGTPVSVLEAMSAGLPTVATTVGENPFLLSQETGLLVPPHQPEKLAAAILSLLDSSQKRAELGSAARARVIQDYGRTAWCRKILALYAKLLPKANEYLVKLDETSMQNKA
ncbi:MAG: glycosyltransferase [Chloroflexi bacterium]|nr:glycosyltransferase [Chloroflexota bacterium]